MQYAFAITVVDLAIVKLVQKGLASVRRWRIQASGVMVASVDNGSLVFELVKLPLNFQPTVCQQLVFSHLISFRKRRWETYPRKEEKWIWVRRKWLEYCELRG